jgi:hypothetical protein
MVLMFGIYKSDRQASLPAIGQRQFITQYCPLSAWVDFSRRDGYGPSRIVLLHGAPFILQRLYLRYLESPSSSNLRICDETAHSPATRLHTALIYSPASPRSISDHEVAIWRLRISKQFHRGVELRYSQASERPAPHDRYEYKLKAETGLGDGKLRRKSDVGVM